MMAIYEIQSDESLAAPVLIQALSGWVDVGSAGTLAAARLVDDGELVATFDTDALFDYRTNRPVLDIYDASMKELAWPELSVRRASYGGRDLLVLTGTEPDLRWKEFASAVREVSLRLGVTQLISLGAVPAAIPHTIPTPVLATASDRSLLAKDIPVLAGAMRVPSAAVSVNDLYLSEAGVPTVGFWAQVPHYVAALYHAGAVALLRRTAEHLRIDIPIEDFEEEARNQRAQLDQIVDARPEAKAYVERLEQMADEQQVPSGEEIAAELERFLRETTDPHPFDDGGSDIGP
jgi:proteasome assembly chaperone (PAC2) family protein